jgi:hypothetical protein
MMRRRERRKLRDFEWKLLPLPLLLFYLSPLLFFRTIRLLLLDWFENKQLTTLSLHSSKLRFRRLTHEKTHLILVLLSFPSTHTHTHPPQAENETASLSRKIQLGETELEKNEG